MDLQYVKNWKVKGETNLIPIIMLTALVEQGKYGKRDFKVGQIVLQKPFECHNLN